MQYSPSEIFAIEMEYRGDSPATLAQKTGIEEFIWRDLINGGSIDNVIADALAHWWRTSPRFWRNIQNQWEGKSLDVM